MGVSKLKQFSKQGLLILGIVSLLGGINAANALVTQPPAPGEAPTTAETPTPETPATAQVTETPTEAQSDTSQAADEFLVCSEAIDWQRPSQEQQKNQLADDGRYGELLQDKEFQQFADQFWHHDVLSFTTYGLSARMEPINLSGLWSVADDVWANCYGHGEGVAINEGALAEAWLMHHQVVDLRWQENHYVMVVEPSSQGMQVVQFARHESETELPLRVVTPQGTVIAHYDADW